MAMLMAGDCAIFDVILCVLRFCSISPSTRDRLRTTCEFIQTNSLIRDRRATKQIYRGAQAPGRAKVTTMISLSRIMIASAVIALDMASAHMTSAHADTCSNQIARLEAFVDQSMGNPVAKPMVPQSIDAQLHHQPTPDSVRRADDDARLRFRSILARAKILDADGKSRDCFQSVAEAKRLLGLN